MKFLIAAAAAATLIPAAALAQSAPPTGAYATLGYANAHADDVDLGAIQGRLGYRFLPWLGVEGELAFGVKDESFTEVVGSTTVTAKVKLKDQEAIYAVAFLPLSDRFDLLARAGYGHQSVKVTASAPGASASESADGGSWNIGVGAQFHFDGKNGVRFDYTRQEFTDDGAGHADTWSIAYSRRF